MFHSVYLYHNLYLTETEFIGAMSFLLEHLNIF